MSANDDVGGCWVIVVLVTGGLFAIAAGLESMKCECVEQDKP